MNIYFNEDTVHSGDKSEHNYLAQMYARYSHGVRYYAGGTGLVYGYACDGFSTDFNDIAHATRRICIKYDDTEVDGSYDGYVTFGNGCDYNSFPIDTQFIDIKSPISQAVLVGNISSASHIAKYVGDIEKVDIPIVIAVNSTKNVMNDIKVMLEGMGKKCSISGCRCRIMAETYMRTSSIILGFHNGVYNSWHSYASYVAHHSNIKYISDMDIVEPMTIEHFIEEEKLRWRAG